MLRLAPKRGLAEADGEAYGAVPTRYRCLAWASLMIPMEAMIDAAHEAVEFDAAWAIKVAAILVSGSSDDDYAGDSSR